MLWLTSIILLATLEIAPPVRLEPPNDPRAHFRLEGLDSAKLRTIADHPETAKDQFQVFTVLDPSKPLPINTPALLGTYQILDHVLTFQPKYPLDRGLTYRAKISGPDTAEVDFKLEAEKPASPSTVVAKVAPGSDLLPENLLKFYIEFSRPMSRGEAYDHLHLLDAQGKALDLPFLELGEELWDHRAMRFTLLFDPGRIKRGLLPREELGPVLEEGKTYTLWIDREWSDAEGLPLLAEFRKTFKVGPADSKCPDPKTWSLSTPKAETRETLVVKFPEPLDAAMLARVVGVHDAKGNLVRGKIAVSSDQMRWSFAPDQAWRAGRHKLRVGKALEDLAGNSVARPFEVDLFGKVGDGSEEGNVEVPWNVLPR